WSCRRLPPRAQLFQDSRTPAPPFEASWRVRSSMALPARREAPSLDVTALVRCHQAGLIRFLRVLGCDARQAEELAHDVFVEVLQRPFADEDPRATAAYLRTVARHRWWKVKRRDGRLTTASLDALEAAFVADCGEDGGDAFVEALRGCIEGLEARS